MMSTKDSDNKLVMAAFAVDVENAAGYAYLFREAKKNPDICLLYTSPSPRD